MVRMLLALSLVVLFATAGYGVPALPGCGGGQPCAACHTMTPQEATRLLKKSGGTVLSVKQAPAPGLFELLVEKGGERGLIYMDYGKKYLFQGVILSMSDWKPVAAHGSEAVQPHAVTHIDPAAIPIKNALVLGNPMAKKRLYVFTDPECPYCRRFHRELQKLEKSEPDLAVIILMFPLPIHPHAYDKARMIIANHSLALLDTAFAGRDIPLPKGDEGRQAVDEMIAFAQHHGITGTPTVVLPDGTVMVGGRDAASMQQILSRF